MTKALFSPHQLVQTQVGRRAEEGRRGSKRAEAGRRGPKGAGAGRSGGPRPANATGFAITRRIGPWAFLGLGRDPSPRISSRISKQSRLDGLDIKQLCLFSFTRFRLYTWDIGELFRLDIIIVSDSGKMFRVSRNLFLIYVKKRFIFRK